MPSFDIVSKTDLSEVDNALANMVREMSQRYDFKGSSCKIERKEAEITINADDDLKLKQMHELLEGISPGARSMPAPSTIRQSKAPAEQCGRRPSSSRASTAIASES
jgi:hypothetical protein